MTARTAVLDAGLLSAWADVLGTGLGGGSVLTTGTLELKKSILQKGGPGNLSGPKSSLVIFKDLVEI